VSEVEAVAAGIQADGGQALPIHCDVTDRAAVEAATDAVVSAFGGLDLLVLNAGADLDGKAGACPVVLGHPAITVRRRVRDSRISSSRGCGSLCPC